MIYKRVNLIVFALLGCLIPNLVLAQTNLKNPPAIEPKVRHCLEKSLEEFPRITDEKERAQVLTYLAEVQSKTGDIPAVLETIEKISKNIKSDLEIKSTQRAALSSLAYAQAKAGDAVSALSTLDRVRNLYEKESQEASNANYFASLGIARAQAERGDVAGALRTVESVSDPRFPPDSKFMFLTKVLVRIGNIDDANRIADYIKDPKTKTNALQLPAAPQIPIESEVQSRATAFDKSIGYLDIAFAILNAPKR